MIKSWDLKRSSSSKLSRCSLEISLLQDTVVKLFINNDHVNGRANLQLTDKFQQKLENIDATIPAKGDVQCGSLKNERPAKRY